MKSIPPFCAPKRAARRSLAWALLAACFLPCPHASASMFHGETLDKIADVMTVIVLIVVPIVLIAVFWMVHILPEKIAEKKGHPQAKAIQCLCLLSLVFGGMLWPLAWLWTYSKPTLHKLAYGTDKHEDHESPQERLQRLRKELADAEMRVGGKS